MSKSDSGSKNKKKKRAGCKKAGCNPGVTNSEGAQKRRNARNRRDDSLRSSGVVDDGVEGLNLEMETYDVDLNPNMLMGDGLADQILAEISQMSQIEEEFTSQLMGDELFNPIDLDELITPIDVIPDMLMGEELINQIDVTDDESRMYVPPIDD